MKYLSLRVRFVTAAVSLTVAACAGSIDTDDSEAVARPPARGMASGATDPVAARPGEPGSPLAPGATIPPTTTTPGNPMSPVGTPPVGGAPPVSNPAAPSAPIAETGLRSVRLTSTQVANVLRVLFGPTGAFDLGRSPLPADPSREGLFASDSALLNFSPTLFEDLFDLVRQVAAKASTTPDKLALCLAKVTDDKKPTDEACVRGFIDSFGKTAFRRPLGAIEKETFFKTYSATRDRDGARVALEVLMRTVVMSPNTMLRMETGVPAQLGGRAVRRLSSLEAASALSFYLTNNPPDALLMQAAEADQLVSEAQVLAQAQRLLQSPAGHAQLVEFWNQLLDLRSVLAVNKAKGFDYFFNPEMRDSLYSETKRFLDAALWEEDGKLTTLLTAPFTFTNGRLASDIYKVPNPPMGDARFVWVRTATNPAERAGLLTQPALMTLLSASDETFPIRRGRFIRERLLCQTLPAPPPGVNADPVPPNPKLTMRQRLLQHSADPSCAACHKLMDPIGLTFEGFDAVGRLRTKELDKPVVTTGSMLMPDGRNLEFAGPVALGALLAKLPEARGCVVRQLFRFALGRAEASTDDPSLAALITGFDASGASLPELALSIAKSDSFRFRLGVSK